MKRLWWLLALLAVVGLIAWLSPDRFAASTTDDAASAEGSPGYMALDADLTETGLDGRPLYRLQATHIARAANSELISLTQPRLSYRPTPDTQWTLRADSGALQPDSQLLRFDGAIEANGGNADEPPIRLRTASLVVNMQQQRADSDDRVYLEQNRMQLNALGLHLNLRLLTWTLDGDGHFTLSR